MLRSPSHIMGHGPTAGVIGMHNTSPRILPSPPRSSLFDSCHRKIRLIGGGPVAFFGGLVAKARRKERDGDTNQSDAKLYLEESVLERKLPDADLRLLVDLPAGLDYNEWLASHTLALFEHVNLVYGTISEFCTTSGCPDMNGPGTRMYLWFDEKGKKTRVAAPQYIDYVMTFTQKTVSDETIFPTKYANEFPSSFESIARKILRLLFHVIAHLYAAHFREVALLGLHAHLNLTFAHLTALHRRFNLVEPKETEVLRDLEIALRLTDDPTVPPTLTSLPSNSNNNNSSNIINNNSNNTSSNSNNINNNVNSSNNNSIEITNVSSTSLSTISTTTSITNSTSTSSTTTINNIGTSIISNNTLPNASSNGSTYDEQQHVIQNNAQIIDGDASVQPIVKQPSTPHCNNINKDGMGGIGGVGVGGCGGPSSNILFNLTSSPKTAASTQSQEQTTA